MSWKRRRERNRKLPRTREHGLGFGVHWGRYQRIPKVPGGPEIGLSASGDVEESRPWSPWKWVVLLLSGSVVAVVAFPFLLTWLFWVGLSGVLIVLIYRTWFR